MKRFWMAPIPRVSGIARGCPARRFARQVATLDTLHQSVEDGVGDSDVAEPAVPVVDWQLRGDDRGRMRGWSSMISSRSARIVASTADTPQSSSTSTSVRASARSQRLNQGSA